MYRFYEDDPVYKLDDRKFPTWAEVCATARLVSKLTGNDTVVYKAQSSGDVDYNETPCAIFFNGVMFVPAINEADHKHTATAPASEPSVTSE